jgi:hypothetical protein
MMSVERLRKNILSMIMISDYTVPQYVAKQMDDDIEQLEAKAEELDRLKLAIKNAMVLYPYKVQGRRETYSEYNQGWQDALSYIESGVEF